MYHLNWVFPHGVAADCLAAPRSLEAAYFGNFDHKGFQDSEYTHCYDDADDEHAHLWMEYSFQYFYFINVVEFDAIKWLIYQNSLRKDGLAWKYQDTHGALDNDNKSKDLAGPIIQWRIIPRWYTAHSEYFPLI